MHISSTINPLSRSEGNIPVAVITFEGRVKFVRVSEDYSDTLERVARAFCIADDSVISIHTASLDVCKGSAVEIDESAYPFMWAVLDEITVKVEGKTRSALSTLRASSLAEIVHKSSISSLKFDDEQAEEEEVAIGVCAEVDDYDAADRNAEEAEAHERELLEAEAEASAQAEAEAAAQAQAQAQAEAVVEAEAAAADLAWDFTEERPKKGKRKSETAQTTPTGKFKPSKIMLGSTKGRDDRSVMSEQIVVEPPRASAPRSAYRSESPLQEPAGPPTAAAAADVDPRFEITILGPESYQIAQFKTRGKHPVRKVLAAACRLFELNYNSAHLYVGVPSARGTRGAVKCEVDATMTQCGVNSHSRLYVRVNNGNEDLESEEEDE